MQIIIHRGSHQIGGIATEIRTASTRILIDMGDELGMESDFISKPLSIRGVTDSNSTCGVQHTHFVILSNKISNKVVAVVCRRFKTNDEAVLV